MGKSATESPNAYPVGSDAPGVAIAPILNLDSGPLSALRSIPGEGRSSTPTSRRRLPRFPSIRGRFTGRAVPADPPPVEIPPLLLDPAADVRAEPAIQPRRQKVKRSWREQRWERRRRRRAAEEILGWILVPLILAVSYWGVKAGLNALGTSPTALYQGLKAAVSGRS